MRFPFYYIYVYMSIDPTDTNGFRDHDLEKRGAQVDSFECENASLNGCRSRGSFFLRKRCVPNTRRKDLEKKGSFFFFFFFFFLLLSVFFTGSISSLFRGEDDEHRHHHHHHHHHHYYHHRSRRYPLQNGNARSHDRPGDTERG